MIFINSFDLLDGSVACAIISIAIAMLKKYTHSQDASHELKIKHRQLKKLYDPLMKILGRKYCDSAITVKRRPFLKRKIPECVWLESLTPKEKRKITKRIDKHFYLAPTEMVNTWYRYIRNGDEHDLYQFYDQVYANYNWTRQCIGLPNDDLINTAYLPKRKSLHLSELLFSIFLTALDAFCLFVYCILPAGYMLMRILFAVMLIVLSFATFVNWANYIELTGFQRL